MNNHRTILAGLLTLGITACFAASSLANDRPCAADVQAYCAGVPKGHGAIRKCLREHKAQLSQACKDSLKHKAKKHHAKRMNAKNAAAATEPAAVPEAGQ